MAVLTDLLVSIVRLRCEKHHVASSEVRILQRDNGVKLMGVCSALYMVLMEHFDSFAEIIESCMDTAINSSKTFIDPEAGSTKTVGGSQIFGALLVVMFQCVCTCIFGLGRADHVVGALLASRTRPRSIQGFVDWSTISRTGLTFGSPASPQPLPHSLTR